jgi:hypothetical protein
MKHTPEDAYESWNAALQQEHRARTAFLHALRTEHATCHTSVLFSLRVQARKELETIYHAAMQQTEQALMRYWQEQAPQSEAI